MHNTGLRIKLPWGANHEHERAIRLAEGFDNVEVLPRLSLEQVAKQLAGARAVVSVDTGLSHLTAALGQPNITLYGPTDPGLIGGYGENQHEIRGAGKNMANITAVETFTALQKISHLATE
jgi:heptosyltransferase-1